VGSIPLLAAFFSSHGRTLTEDFFFSDFARLLMSSIDIVCESFEKLSPLSSAILAASAEIWGINA